MDFIAYMETTLFKIGVLSGLTHKGSSNINQIKMNSFDNDRIG